MEERPKPIKRGSSVVILEPGMTREEFYELQQHWYKKVREYDQDAKDIERVLPDGNSSDFTLSAIGVQGRNYNADYIQSQQDYYSNASAFTHHREAWPNAIEKQVWEMHADGYSYRDIVNEIRPNHPIGIQRVHKIVTTLKIEMMIWAKQEAKEAQAEEDLLLGLIEFEKNTSTEEA